jgi:hypothetical protein
MKGSLIAAILALCCAAALAQTGEGGGPPAAAAQSMYKVADVVGVLVKTHDMYQDGDINWYSGRLRVDEGLESGEPKAGRILRVRYAMPGRARVPSEGDQVRASLHQLPVVGTRAPEWMATKPPEVLGRGDFVRPGERPDGELGSPKARILVKMFAPFGPECHKKTTDLLKELAKREPDRVRVQLFHMRGLVGQQELRRERLNCATVLVNNRYKFTLIEPDGERKVVLSHRPNEPGSSYRSEDVIAVVEQELKRLYP